MHNPILHAEMISSLRLSAPKRVYQKIMATHTRNPIIAATQGDAAAGPVGTEAERPRAAPDADGSPITRPRSSFPERRHRSACHPGFRFLRFAPRGPQDPRHSGQTRFARFLIQTWQAPLTRFRCRPLLRSCRRLSELITCLRKTKKCYFVVRPRN